jgi:GH15 family glucan-1,4-alpha-glucosidase
VHKYRNLFVNRIEVENLGDRTREFRLLFYHDFRILENDIGDTAYYDPDTGAVIHYKRDIYILISGAGKSGRLDGYHTGRKDSWKAMESGCLGNTPITQGQVDSVAALDVEVGPRQRAWTAYWMALGHHADEVRKLDREVRDEGVEHFIEETSIYHASWVNKEDRTYADLDQAIVDLYKRSLLVMRTQIDNNGAIVAGNDTDYLKFNRDHYSYMWPRDGALTAYALDEAGYSEISRRFFRFCARVIGDKGYFLHKFSPDGTLASSWHPWYHDGKTQLPIQEDETGLVLFALDRHYSIYRDIEFIDECYHTLVRPCAEFMVAFREPVTLLPAPSYDLWEERKGISSFTVSAVYGGLRAASALASLLGNASESRRYSTAAGEIKRAAERYLYDGEKKRFVRMINVGPSGEIFVDDSVESSTWGLFAFGLLDPDDERVKTTMEAVREKLWVNTTVGGIARYTGDQYHRVSEDIEQVPGNPWVICTLWLAEHAILTAGSLDELKEAGKLLEWAVKRRSPAGLLAEQYNPYNGEPLSVSPLTWSHGTFCRVVHRYVQRHTELTAPGA